ncbi:hypothetical protein [Vibrio hepatarius]|uniref:hypothetical protein n=1 Tax=Vibrio hepatarius TaxID=171383 RepID=UPI00373600DB
MRSIYLSAALILVLMAPSTIANYKSYTFQVSANIDRSNMLADTVSLKLSPSSITLSYDPTISTFANKLIKLTIESDFSSFDSKLKIKSYQLFLLNNISNCYASTKAEFGNKLDAYENIANVHIDNKAEPMTIGEAITYSNTTFESKTHDLMLKFKTVGEDVKSCNGAFVVGFRYDI